MAEYLFKTLVIGDAGAGALTPPKIALAQKSRG